MLFFFITFDFDWRIGFDFSFKQTHSKKTKKELQEDESRKKEKLVCVDAMIGIGKVHANIGITN